MINSVITSYSSWKHYLRGEQKGHKVDMVYCGYTHQTNRTHLHTIYKSLQEYCLTPSAAPPAPSDPRVERNAHC